MTKNNLFKGAKTFRELANRDTDVIYMTRYGFENRIYRDPWDVAVHFAISVHAYSGFERNGKRGTSPISLNSIADTLGLNTKRNKNRVYDPIKDSLKTLVSTGAIELKPIMSPDKEEDKRFIAYITPYLTSSGNQSYLTVELEEYSKLLNADETNANKVRLFSVFIAMVRRLFRVDPNKYWDFSINNTQFTDNNFEKVMVLENAISFESSASIGEIIGLSTTSVKRTIDDLHRLELIKSVIVERKGSGDNTHKNIRFFSRHSEMIFLQTYLDSVLKSVDTMESKNIYGYKQAKADDDLVNVDN